MANSGKPNDNGSQFFLTLGESKELNGKNTLFGKVVGETIYNLVKIGERELEEEGSEKMLYPVKITGTEVLVNPFEDMVPREDAGRNREKVEEASGVKNKVVKKKLGKKGGKALLSFGGDEEGEDVMPVRKIKFDARLVKAIPEEQGKGEGGEGEKVLNYPTAKSKTQRRSSPSATSSRSPSPVPASKAKPKTTIPVPPRSPTPDREKAPRDDSFLSKTNAQIAALKSSLKRGGTDPTPHTAPPAKKRSLLAIQKEMLPPTSVKGRKRKWKGKRVDADDDDDTFDALERFRRKLEKAGERDEASATPTTAASSPPASGEAQAENSTPPPLIPAPANDEEEEPQLCDLHFIPNCLSCQAWEAANPTASNNHNPDIEEGDAEDIKPEDFLSHTLRFEKDRLGKDLNWKKDHEYDDGLVVIDPREKGRELLEAKSKGRGSGRGVGWRGGRGKGGGGGAGGRDWDRDRDRDRASGTGSSIGSGSGSWRGR